jgi:hypothetical protein
MAFDEFRSRRAMIATAAPPFTLAEMLDEAP